MLTLLTEQFEKLALRTDPGIAIALLNSTPQSVLRSIQLARFRKTMRLAARAPFYAEEFKKRGIDPRRVRRPEDLGGFFTTAEDIRRDPEKFVIGRPDTAFETTGTTSSVTKRVFFSSRELNEMGRVSAIGLHQLGLRGDDRVLSAFDVSFWVSPAVIRTAFQYIGCFHAEAGKIPPDEFYERARRYKPTVIFGEPSWMVRLAEIAAKRGAWPVKFLFAGGENLNESTRSEVERIWRAPLYLNYGQTESFGTIGVECARKNGYHRNDLSFYFEIADAEEDGFGELVYTTLTRDVMPLIRYRSTDVTRLVDELCSCGFFAPRIAKIRGRCDEMVVCGMGNVGPWVFAEMLRGVPYVSDEWQARIWHEDRTDVVELLFETQVPLDAAAEKGVSAHILSNLNSRLIDMAKNLGMQLYELRLSPVHPGTLRTSRKLRRVVGLTCPPAAVKLLQTTEQKI